MTQLCQRSAPAFTRILCPDVLSAAATRAALNIAMACVSEAGQVLEGGLYHRRRTIETTLAELKVTQRMEGGLRGRSAASIRFEAAGHAPLYLPVCWLMVGDAADHGIADRRRLSFVSALRELEDMKVARVYASPGHVHEVLLPRFLGRIAQHLIPLRPGRHDPRPDDTKYKNRGEGKRGKPSNLTGDVNTKSNAKRRKHKIRKVA